uniref:Uncharacterized protein n=1 Tax=Dunaliella tertiolecta TaxID=3047 RepID=A0A7S3VUT2_DUNTE|mmetsp:Transcript_4518/g.12338  ORF Transcript_4518/g.12338 Transcript_4518/m.12338 type:complete len:508 (+) Transcript_4518:79-1602(+)
MAALMQIHRLLAHSKLQCNAPHVPHYGPRRVAPALQCHAQHPQQDWTQHSSGTSPQAPPPPETLSSFDEASPSAPMPRRKPLKKRSKSSIARASASGVGRVVPPPQTEQASSPMQEYPSSPDLRQGPRDLVFRHSVKGSSGSSLDDASWDDESWVQPQRPAGNCDRGERGGGDHTCIIPKPIMILSDCTGESAARTVKAALSQFEACFDTTAPATLMVTRFLEDEQRAFQMVEQAAKQDALLVYTLVDRKVLTAVQTACKLFNVRHVDLWSNLLDHMEEHLESSRSGIPMTQHAPRHQLGEDYFKMIEAVEYTRKMDDGSNPKEWKHADLMIIGVSRSGKTPLCIYLGQRGYKVANLPLVPGIPPPKELYEIDQARIVGLTIDPNVLLSIRRNRIGMMGASDFSVPLSYAGMQEIQAELKYARELYAANPEWPVLDVTFRGVEETAARVLKILNDKRGTSSPQWVEELYGGMQAASQGAGPRPAPTQSMVAEQIYAVGEQCLVEGLY